MKVTKASAANPQRDTADIFDGHVERWGVVGEESPQFRLTLVSFKAGGKTKMHTHLTDQLLIVASGHGALGDGKTDLDLDPGDVAWIPAGERHWHGAKAGGEMAHWSCLGPGAPKVG